MISTSDYQFLAELVRRETGIALGPGKDYLLETRLEPVATVFCLQGIPAVVSALRRGVDRKLPLAVCEAMTTHETLFFRDNNPFVALRQTLLPLLAERRRATTKRLRIWSAAVATGQEAYSIAMTIEEMGAVLAGLEIEILGTDYSADAIARARAGVYSQFEVQRGLPAAMLVKYFSQSPLGWSVHDNLRRRVAFREDNLLHPFGHLGAFDIIFCRNVLIYFDGVTKQDVLERMAVALAPDGVLLLGSAETPLNVTNCVVRMPGVAESVYVRAPRPCHTKPPLPAEPAVKR